MLTFLQFITEVKRDKERAAKLGEYLVKREKKRTPWMSPHFVVGNDEPDPNYKHDANDQHDMEAFSKAWTYAHSKFRRKNIVDVPIKDIMKDNHQIVHFDKDYTLKHKDKDERPMNIARSRRTGNLFVVDGYHRLAWNWLQGKSHIKANLQDVGRKGKK